MDIDVSPLIPLIPLMLNALFSPDRIVVFAADRPLGAPTETGAETPLLVTDGCVALGEGCLPFADFGRATARRPCECASADNGRS